MTSRPHRLWDYWPFRSRNSAAFEPSFPRLSSEHASIQPTYDVVVVGSGYGGSIAASRCARAGQTVCVLERGKEWLPGEFPESYFAAFKEIQVHPGGKDTIGKASNLYEFYVTDNVSVVQGCGLGGGSLINANVGLDADPRVFEDKSWPSELKQDLDNLMKIDRKHVVDMLKPTPYPDHYPELDKIKRMREGFDACDIEDIDKAFYKPPIYVTFEDTPFNHVGVPQPKCTGCGNCCGGCNVGAKNTLNLNYLPDAKAHGAEIFTEVEVMSVTRAPDDGKWLVKYKRLVNGFFKVDEETIRAAHVIIGAGALGSTKILLRSKERGLNVSNQIGKNFSTNGDALGFSYNGAKSTNSVGLKTKDMAKNNKGKPPGPCIASVMDFRKTTKGTHKKGFVIEDGTPPSAISGVYCVGLTVAARLIGIERYSSEELLELKECWKELAGTRIDKSLSFLCMSHDDANGTISYNKDNDSVDITWPNIGSEKNFATVNQAMEKVTTGLSGTFVRNPMWTEALGKSVISAHPLGGCPMGKSGRTAVVNHAGQVFDGDSDSVLEGLYVVDGAILPIAVGVNPTLTISCLAERCLRLLAKREGWHIDYDAFKPLDPSNFVKQKPGIRFTEKMVGEYESPDNKGKKIPCEFTLTIESDDVERMLNCDKNHSADISGTVKCSALSSSPLTVSDGHFQLFSTSEEHIDTKEMVYKMTLTGDEDKQFSFEGVKYIHKDHFGETGLKDTTKLFVKIFRLDKKELLGTAILYITPANFAKQMETMEIINTHSMQEKLVWLARFGAFFAKTLWDVYGPVSSLDKYFNPKALPRTKRALKLRGHFPEVYNCITQDKFKIALTRYNGGTKGPVVMFHGAGVSSGMFSLDTIDTNLVEYLVQHSYDVWLVDWRTSCNLPSMGHGSYTLDDCAAYDYPAAINKVIEVTKQKDVQVFAHCAGSLVCFASLLSGALQGKVRSLVASQVAANPIPCPFNKMKAGLHIPEVMEALGFKGLTVYTDDQTTWAGWLFNTFVKGIGYTYLPYNELCRNPVCHRISFTYGLLWEHENLNPLTHDTLHEFFGYITAECSSQLALTMREKKLVSASGEDIYLPDMTKDRQAYEEHIKRLDIPICFIVGEKNSCYLPESTLTTYNLAKEAHPHQEYSWIQIPGYGHLDCIFGRNAVYDVYPHILRALDAHSQDLLHRDKNAVLHVLRAVDSLKLEDSGDTDITDAPLDDKRLLYSDLPPEQEVMFRDAVDLPGQLSDDDASRLDFASLWDEISKTNSLKSIQTASAESKMKFSAPLKGSRIADGSANALLPGVASAASIWDENSELTSLGSFITWPSGPSSEVSFKKKAWSIPETERHEEGIFVREMINPNDPVKNVIISMSDLHLDSIWCETETERIQKFIRELVTLAGTRLHTFVIVGDALEMWLDSANVKPKAINERIMEWRSNKTCRLLFESVRKMSQEHNVKVFYLRGNHDHEMDAETVKTLMGDGVEFIEGSLIYVIKSDDGQTYRIRFAHGHDWDMFNTYSLSHPDDPMGGRPIGYYVTRAVATSVRQESDTEKVIMDIAAGLLKKISSEFAKTFVVETLANSEVQENFTRHLIESAMGRRISGDECIRLDDGRWIKMENVLKYRYFHRAIEKFGPSKTFSLINGSLGRFDDFLLRCEENVVVLAHTHVWKEQQIEGTKSGGTYYVNTGTWIDNHEFSYAYIVPPTRAKAGLVKVKRNFLSSDED